MTHPRASAWPEWPPGDQAPQSESPDWHPATLGDKVLENEHPQCTDMDARRKAYEGLRAGLALAGNFALHELGDGSFLVTRWNLTKPLADLTAVRAFARQVGAVT